MVRYSGGRNLASSERSSGILREKGMLDGEGEISKTEKRERKKKRPNELKRRIRKEQLTLHQVSPRIVALPPAIKPHECNSRMQRNVNLLSWYSIQGVEVDE